MPSPLYSDSAVDVLWVPWAEWGIDNSTRTFIANRTSDPILGKKTIQVHNTAAIDNNDSTPNNWSYAEAVSYMNRLEWARPDLGPLPYSENLAVAEDFRTVWLFEGRGLLKRGAHTAGHNVDGIGWGVFGNFDMWTGFGTLRAIIRALEFRVGDLRANHGFVNLGSVPNPRGWNAWGHRDSSSKSCPGNNLYPLLADFRLDYKGENRMFVRDLTAETWGFLYDKAIITDGNGQNPPSNRPAVIAYWMDPARPISELIHVTNVIVRGLAGLGALDAVARTDAARANNRLNALKAAV